MSTRNLIRVGLLFAAITALTLFIAGLPAWVWHPLFGKGYQLWSGIASDISEVTLPVSIITGFVIAHRFLHEHFECHQDSCSKIGVHRIADSPYRTCWSHHPILSQHTKHGVPRAHLLAVHQAAQGETS